MADSLDNSWFDVMNGLQWPIDALALPHDIIKVENEEYAVAAVTEIVAPGLDEVGDDGREQAVADLDQHPRPLMDFDTEPVRDLEEFQALERVRFGVYSTQDVSSGRETIFELAEDYYPSEEDESLQD